MTMIGQEIDDFKVNAYQDLSIREVTKKDLLGHWSVLFFYPADFSFVCPTELGDLADHYQEFKDINAEIYSVSEDTEFVHQAWHLESPEVGKTEYPMIADPAGVLARYFGVLDEEAGQAYRGVFILDPEGKIQSYTINNMGIGRNAEEILRTLQAAQFVAEHGDQVCPANWKPGEKTLTPGVELVGKI
ncbi:redoxin domain-containing protein [Secundilactobacillus kimchicus]|uniref:Alkyl hydroperoxide reductase C n=1 Tax=Secundilactobacillus kimchicus JCM 15530 TaxID=1302272 RepID=A0A0R1HXM9_9LACO|nr:redoxin domain-containing protein [Secundilactobacillus kimchicus]KRK48337.1 peroxiredoxin [Secundilactobacillus kimchicus JCM 15530]MBT9671103.1 redoxin domain-containing protein [Secundilactobacillus kimchicus]